MNEVVMRHANTHREVVISRFLVYAIQYSEANKCTHIISNAGAIIPVLESVEEARRLIYNNAVTKES